MTGKSRPDNYKTFMEKSSRFIFDKFILTLNDDEEDHRARQRSLVHVEPWCTKILVVHIINRAWVDATMHSIMKENSRVYIYYFSRVKNALGKKG